MPLKIETQNIRTATEHDLPFIEQMCYEAAYPDGLGERPPFEDARQLDWFQKYTQDWPMHDGDFGLIAEDEAGQSLGAAWYRDYPRKDLSADIPTHELSIALIRDARGQHIGEKLMQGLLKGAAENNVDLSLQVNPDNKAAKSLYEKLGFKTEAVSEDGYDVMVSRTAK